MFYRTIIFCFSSKIIRSKIAYFKTICDGASGVPTLHVCLNDGVKNYQHDEVSNGMILLFFCENWSVSVYCIAVHS
jgi:hypothetical protein